MFSSLFTVMITSLITSVGWGLPIEDEVYAALLTLHLHVRACPLEGSWDGASDIHTEHGDPVTASPRWRNLRVVNHVVADHVLSNFSFVLPDQLICPLTR